MGKPRWNLAAGLFAAFAVLAILTAGCGTKGQEELPIPTPQTTLLPTPTSGAAWSAFATDEDAWKKPEAGLREDLPKKDAAAQAEYNGMNRMIFNDIDKNHQSLFCIDADTGVVYFVNQNKDFYIYRIKDGAVELAVAMPAKELYAYGGSLYFMAESYGIYQMGEVKNGDIYRYTPKDGTIELVYAAGKLVEEVNAWQYKMWVDETGVYFECFRTEEVEKDGVLCHMGKIDSYRLPFGAEDPVDDPLQMAYRPGWGDYYLAFYSPVRLINRTDASEIREFSPDSPGWSYIMGDKLYYLPGASDITRMSVLDLVTGVQEDYSIWEALKEIYYVEEWKRMGHKNHIVTDEEMEEICKQLAGATIANAFTATEQYLWMVVKGHWLIRIDKKTKETFCIRVDQDGLLGLYTDGEQIYGMCTKDVLVIPATVARILTEEVLYDELLREDYITVEYLTD